MRPANDAGVVESTENQQPPLIYLLDAAQICPLLCKAGKFVVHRFQTSFCNSSRVPIVWHSYWRSVLLSNPCSTFPGPTSK